MRTLTRFTVMLCICAMLAIAHALGVVALAQPVYVNGISHVNSVELCADDCLFEDLSLSSTGEVTATFRNADGEVIVTDTSGTVQNNWLSVAGAQRPKHLAAGGDFIGLDLDGQVVLENANAERVSARISKRFVIGGRNYRPFSISGLDRNGHAYGLSTSHGKRYVWTFDPQIQQTTIRRTPWNRKTGPSCMDSSSSMMSLATNYERKNSDSDILIVEDLWLWERLNRPKPVQLRISRSFTKLFGSSALYTTSLECGKSVFGEYLLADNYRYMFHFDDWTDSAIRYRDELSIEPLLKPLSLRSLPPGDVRSDDRSVNEVTRSGFILELFSVQCQFITKDHARSTDTPALKSFILSETGCGEAIEQGNNLFVASAYLTGARSPQKIVLHHYILNEVSLSEIAKKLERCRPCTVRTAREVNRSVNVVRMLDEFGESVTQQSIEYLGERLVNRIGWRQSQRLLEQAGTILKTLPTNQAQALLWNLYQTKRNNMSGQKRAQRWRSAANRNNLAWSDVKSWIRYL